jgi:non-heme chloroperoxidase
MKKIVVAILVIVTIIFIVIQWKVYQINNAPEEFTYEKLSQQPVGKEIYITCPDGTKLRTISAGKGQTILLAHGFGGAIHNWNLVFEQLVKDGFHVIAFDQRGHTKSSVGKDGVSSTSMASDYKTILEFYDVKNAVLVGHSMGGFLSIKFMLDYPEVTKQRLKSALILGSFAGDINKDNDQNKYQIPLIKDGWIDKVLGNESLATLMQASVIGKPYKSLVRSALDDFTPQNFVQLTPILQAFVDENYYPRLKEIIIPCTIMVGTVDKTAPNFHSENLSRGIQKASLIKVEGKGHLLNWEAPKEVCEQIEKLAR